MVHLTECFYHVTYEFQSESALYICLNVKELLVRNSLDISRLNNCNRIPTHNHLVCKWPLNHLLQLTKWLCWVVTSYLYGVFDCIFLSVTYAFQSESTLYICLNVKELLASNRGDIWRLSDCNSTRTHNHFLRQWTLNRLAELTILIELSCDYLCLWCIWLYILIMLRTSFRVNPISIFAWISKNS